MQARLPEATGARKRLGYPVYTAHVDLDDRVPVQCAKPPQEDDVTRADLERDARNRVQLLHAWLDILGQLVHAVSNWAEELDWSTREIEKPMEDSEIGNYKAPALLLQDETTKALLEPVARSSPDSEGLVDLYLMPGYDDIASVYYYNNRWNLHHRTPDEPGRASSRDADAKPLTKASFRKALDEMKKHAQSSFRLAHED